MPKKTLTTCLTLLCLSQITACGPIYQTDFNKDGPPPFNIDPKTIPDAIPKKERQIDKNTRYSVKGKKYRVLGSSRNYNKTGLASWYGRKFHGKPTSYNEPFNMYGMTAASKDLPLPSYVRVTNLSNNRQVVVKINDRGPFHKNRIIDLSYMAAKKLGYIGKGTTLVRVTSIDPPFKNTRLANNNIKIAPSSKHKTT
jgi:rare lipoprotein A